ncbi:MAG TPA: hypothetical protein VF794_23260 [Archangium sp.]|jgi:hypothetical protein|uniref:DUF6968 family protein n=1 Tax=Archangium sp. TaxID=1872627 RepID=UPI002ED92D7E
MATRAKRAATKKKASPRALGTVIAERTLTFVEPKASLVRIRIGKPRKARTTGDYFCPFSIESLGNQKVHEAWGIDSIQALQNALQAIRLELAPHENSLEWEGGQDGWLGFPKVVPDLFGPRFTRRLEDLVERETERFARGLEAASRQAASEPAGGRKRSSRPRR